VSSHALDQHRVAGVRFDVAMLTNLGRDHLDYHETLAAYGDAKAKLFDWEGLKTIVLNHDDEFGKGLEKKFKDKKSKDKKSVDKKNVEILSYCVVDQVSEVVSSVSEDDVSAEYLTAVNPQYSASGIQADFHFKGDTEVMSAPVLGKFNIYNLLAATGCLMGLGQSFSEAVNCIKQVKTVPGRMEKVSTPEDRSLVVVDFAHTPGALEAALKAMREHTPSRLVCVFGCGGDRDRGKRPMMAQVAEQYADMVVLTDDNPRSEMPFQIMHDMIEGLENPEHVAMEHDRAKAIRFAVGAIEQGDSVLIAVKGHETVQIVGDEKHPFDDRDQARAALKELSEELSAVIPEEIRKDMTGDAS
jgi:UDP-N-acetylmuramoyl-L-alanyl-D-glutamate--2,6-diaminopimelate ligase